MLIGQLAKKTGYSRDTIRYYEKIGLINLGRRQRRDNDYKEYPEYLVDRLNFVTYAKHMGFTLREIQEMIEMWEVDALECEDVFSMVRQKSKDLEKQIEQLKRIKNNLDTMIAEASKCAGSTCDLEFEEQREREVSAKNN